MSHKPNSIFEAASKVLFPENHQPLTEGAQTIEAVCDDIEEALKIASDNTVSYSSFYKVSKNPKVYLDRAEQYVKYSLKEINKLRLIKTESVSEEALDEGTSEQLNTVGQLISALQKFPERTKIAVELTQLNKPLKVSLRSLKEGGLMISVGEPKGY